MRVVPFLVYILFLGQAAGVPVQEPPAVETPVTYSSAAGPILLPNRCAEADLGGLGLTCSESEPCQTYLEFSSVEALGTVLLLAGNIHTTTTTIQSILLVSENGGVDWREAHKRLSGSALESMQFLDFSTGWLTGQSSLGLPRDPFVMVTTNSGRTWRKVDLFAESRVGVIEDFAFQSARRGWLVVDNRGSGEAGKFELYETQTGGTSWELREISNTNPRADQAGLRKPSTAARIRVDDGKGLLRIEVRAGNGWREVSAFKLKLEDCKPDL